MYMYTNLTRVHVVFLHECVYVAMATLTVMQWLCTWSGSPRICTYTVFSTISHPQPSYLTVKVLIENTNHTDVALSVSSTITYTSTITNHFVENLA